MTQYDDAHAIGLPDRKSEHANTTKCRSIILDNSSSLAVLKTLLKKCIY